MNASVGMKDSIFASVTALERSLWGRRYGRVALSEVKDFLLLQYPSALGTAVHATPLVSALRRAVPGCRIVVAASGMALEIFRHHPGVDALVETPNPLRDLKGAVLCLRSQTLFDGRPFATLTSTGNERTKIGLASVLSGASVRVGFTVAPGLFRVPLRFDPAKSQIANNLRIVEVFDKAEVLQKPAAFEKAEGHNTHTAEPEVFFGEEDLAFARRLLVEHGVDLERPIAVLVTQTSVTQRKSWRPERFREVASFLRERFGAQIVFVGTQGERETIDALRAGLPFKTANVAGATNLLELTALLKLADVGLTLDTGTMHLGRAVGLPMVIVAPAWSPPIEWLPLHDPRYVILKNLDLASAPENYIIDEVSVGEVTSALERLLAMYPAGSRR